MKALDSILLGLGILLVACGHVKWWTSHANDEVTAARSIGYLVPGWTMLAMGYFGLRASQSTKKKDDGV
jgi:hypothetical protein